MMEQTQYWLDEHQCIAAIEMGNAKTAAKTVVFVHGWMDNAASFISVMASMLQSKPDWHLIAIDLPGHGLSSSKGEDNFYPFHDYIDDLHRTLLKLSANEVVLVGHSLGALVTSCYSAAFPEKIAALVEIEGYGPLAEEAENGVKRLRSGIESRLKHRDKPTKSLSDPEDAVRLRAVRAQVSQDLIRPLVYRALEQVEDRWLWRHDEKLKCDSLYRMSAPHRQNVLDSLICPHLVILGEKGFSKLKSIDKSGQPNEFWFTVPGGHHCHLECPDQVSQLIVDLVNKI